MISIKERFWSEFAESLREESGHMFYYDYKLFMTYYVHDKDDYNLRITKYLLGHFKDHTYYMTTEEIRQILQKEFKEHYKL